MTEAEWNAPHVRSLGAILAGGDIGEVDERGAPVIGETMLYLLNAGEGSIPFPLPALDDAPGWTCLLDTADDRRQGRTYRTGSRYRLRGRSVAVLRPPPARVERGRAARRSRSTAEQA